jgi:NAD(P)-dependent dehydrogenase (short-subunit alcohol dehydrogenase family)
MSRWDAKEIPDLQGRTAVVTGANSGLGLQTAVLLAGAGARVLMACRNPAKARDAAARVGEGAETVTLDLASLASVAEAAEAVKGKTSRLDILVNNAGLMAVDQARTADGFEMQFGVNHLGHFAFTAHLAPLLLAAPEARVVNVSSVGHRPGTIDFGDLMFERRRYDRWRPYFQSKLANLLFTAELERRFRLAGSPAKGLGAHPGATRTDLGHEGNGLTNALVRPFSRLEQPATIGALPTVRAAVDPKAKGGEFYGPQFLFIGYPVREMPSRRARNGADARRLWEESERLTGVTFKLP